MKIAWDNKKCIVVELYGMALHSSDPIFFPRNNFALNCQEALKPKL